MRVQWMRSSTSWYGTACGERGNSTEPPITKTATVRPPPRPLSPNGAFVTRLGLSARNSRSYSQALDCPGPDNRRDPVWRGPRGGDMSNIQVTHDADPNNARSESAIAVNPNNPSQVVAASK